MFDKKNKIVIMIYGNVMLYPPVINLIECLLNNSYRVHLVAEGIDDLPRIITEASKFSSHNVLSKPRGSLVNRITRRHYLESQYRRELSIRVEPQDILWTVNPIVVRILGKRIEKYSSQHIMQLFELMENENIPLFNGSRFFKFNIAEISRHAWKNVVAERNRAYIQKAQWGLKRLPYILPNKPYYYEPGEESAEIRIIIDKMKNESRRVIIYLGVIDPDRDFESFARAIESIKEDYCLYMFGKVPDDRKEAFQAFCKKYKCVEYMGFFNPPSHLHFLKYAHIALVPYAPGKTSNNTSSINALYCAPNKIYEYAGSSLPMLGTDVLGLREPFEHFNIGMCCDDLEPKTIVNTIRMIESHYNEMKMNCVSFYNSTDLDQIIDGIVNDD